MKKKAIVKTLDNGRTGVIQAPRKGGLNNLACTCGGTLVRQRHDGSLKCSKCGSRRVETPL